MRNQMWDAATALKAGLLSHVVDDDKLGDEAWALARELAAGPTMAFGEIKNLLLSTGSLPIEAQMEQEARAIARVTRSEMHGTASARNRVLGESDPEVHRSSIPLSLITTPGSTTKHRGCWDA